MDAVFLDGYLICPSKNSVTSPDGEVTLLQPKFLQVLLLLVEAYPAPVSREDLIDRVWDGNFIVGDKALNNAIWNLRSSLSNNSSSNFIQTKRGKGYSLSIEPRYAQSDNDLKIPLTGDANRFVPLLTFRPSTKSLLVAFLVITSISYLLVLAVSHIYSFHISPRSTHPFFIETNIPGQEFYPVVSKDDRYLAFVGRSNGRHNIFIKDRGLRGQIFTYTFIFLINVRTQL